MKFEKTVISHLNRGYCCAALMYQGKHCVLSASEKDDCCLLFDDSGKLIDTVWTSIGGTMSIEQIPGSDGRFIAIQKFYSPVDSENAQLVYVYHENNQWIVRLICKLPFVHRFSILQRGNRNYLIAATLKTKQSSDNPWLEPGKVWAAEIPSWESFHSNCHLDMYPILENLSKNHGFLKHVVNNTEVADVCCENGIYRLIPPASIEDNWTIKMILDCPASDLACVDLNNDGKEELIVFSPFHGDTLRVFQHDGTSYHCVYEKSGLDFLHAVWGGYYNGKPTAIIGHRQNGSRLFTLTFEDGSYKTSVIDTDRGPSNVEVFAINGVESIWAMNCETNEIALYSCRK